jgi:Arm DNA-binding domain
MKQRLTNKIVKDLPIPAIGNRITYDTEVIGLGARITAGGARSYVLNYRTREGRERRLTIGDTTIWPIDAAREEAKRLKRDIDVGGDPVAELTYVRNSRANICPASGPIPPTAAVAKLGSTSCPP